jgi:soluble epoxide hydrolase/lipid-phosphate phosphatase
MSSSPIPRESFETARGYKYSYLYCPCAGAKPTLLLIHGWPSHAEDWLYQIRYFRAKGYGLLVPDMLGYGASSSPPDTADYRLKCLCDDVAQLLNHRQLSKVVGIGHDWGATILSRFAVYYPERLEAAAFLGVGPACPGAPFDLDAINEATRKATGTEMLGYIFYISRDGAAPPMMEKNAPSVMDVLFTADPSTWTTHFHSLQGFKTFVEQGRRQRIGDWYPAELRARHLEVFSRRDGHLGPSQYYKMLDQNLSRRDEEGLGEFKMGVFPKLLVIPEQPAAATEMQIGMLNSWAPGLVVVTVDSGHWVHLERSEETNRAIETMVMQLEA